MLFTVFTFTAMLGSLSAVAAVNCTREGLLAAAASYIDAQRTGSLAGLRLAPANFTYRENNKVVDISHGILTTALAIDAHRSTADTVACASYTMLIAARAPTPYVLATQIRHRGNDDDATITMIDTIAATTGSLFFNASQTLAYVAAEAWPPLPHAQQPSRALLRAVGDAYLDMWTDPGAADTIPWGTQCERVEGARLTRPCGGSLPRGGSATANGMRRYVIDEVLGSVDVLCSFDALGSLPDSHEIRVEGGKVKYVHTITV